MRKYGSEIFDRNFPEQMEKHPDIFKKVLKKITLDKEKLDNWEAIPDMNLSLSAQELVEKHKDRLNGIMHFNTYTESWVDKVTIMYSNQSGLSWVWATVVYKIDDNWELEYEATPIKSYS